MKKVISLVCLLSVLCLCGCGSQNKAYEELIVGSWKTDDDADVISFYYSGIWGYDEGGGARWEIDGDTLILYNDYHRMEATIETLNEEELVITYDGRTEYYHRLSFEPYDSQPMK